jgi:hypothetical protein
MVAADYSAKRSAMAKAAGLGRKATATLPVTPPETIVAELLKPRVRGKLSLFGRSASGNS